MSVARSIAEVISRKEPVRQLVLRASKDLVCNNLFCEKVTEPCVCRLDRMLSSKKLTELRELDLSNNRLNVLPPSIGTLTSLEVLNISGNNLKQIPAFVDQLPSLKVLKLCGNPVIYENSEFRTRKYEVIID
jgi:Leucine-rich repeat (LRR) protein